MASSSREEQRRRNPSPFWMIGLAPLASIVMILTTTATIEIYTQVICQVHAPEEYNTRVFNGGSRTTNKCSSNAPVQAALATFLTATSLAVGILGSFTTAWWGALSDRIGRQRVLRFAALGPLLSLIPVILFATAVLPPQYYWASVIGFIFEGLLGGSMTIFAASFSYIADVSEPDQRSRLYSLLSGFTYIGIALAPLFGNMLIKFTGSANSVLFFSGCVISIHVLTIWIFLPESKHFDSHAQEAPANIKTSLVSRLFGFLAPLAIFIPRKMPSEGGRQQRDWTLTLLAAAYALMMSIGGSTLYQVQYGSFALHFSIEQLNILISLLGMSRAVYLTLILPAVIYLLKPKIGPTNDDGEEQPLVAVSSAAAKQKLYAFDLALARNSVFLEMMAYVIPLFFPTQKAFYAYSIASGTSAGFPPALQSLALQAYTQIGGKQSTGELFGALSVLQSLSSAVCAPSLFGWIFVATISTYPRAIFALIMSFLIASLLLLLSVKLPPAIVLEEDDDVSS